MQPRFLTPLLTYTLNAEVYKKVPDVPPNLFNAWETKWKNPKLEFLSNFPLQNTEFIHILFSTIVKTGKSILQ